MSILNNEAYRSTSSEAFCILAGTKAIIIKAEEAANRYQVWKGRRANIQKIDRLVELNQWPQPADFINIPETEGCDDETVRIFADASEGQSGVGPKVVIFVKNELLARNKLKLNVKCCNKQSEQLVIVYALDLIYYLEIADIKPRRIGVYTDRRIAIDSIKNASNHNFLIEEIRNRLVKLRSAKWTIEFS